jgi:hypothetical protein
MWGRGNLGKPEVVLRAEHGDDHADGQLAVRATSRQQVAQRALGPVMLSNPSGSDLTVRVSGTAIKSARWGGMPDQQGGTWCIDVFLNTPTHVLFSHASQRLLPHGRHGHASQRKLMLLVPKNR